MDDIIIACTETLTLWNFYPSYEAAEADLANVKANYLNDSQRCEDNHANHGYNDRDPDYWLKQAAKYRLQAQHSKVMTYAQFQSTEADKILSAPLREITEEQFDYALNVLPPLKWGSNGGVYSFFMSEFQTGDYTHQYAQMAGRFWVKVVNFRKSDTWIKASMIDSAEVLNASQV